MTNFYLPVCSENLVKLLTFGLISADRVKPLSGRNPFVTDALSGYSGEIPLFVDKVPSKEINKIKEVDKYLHACILEIDIKKITKGSFRTNLNTSGSFPLSKPDTDLGEGAQWISIFGPIPVTLIKAFYFPDKEAKEDFLLNLKAANIASPKNIKPWKKSLLTTDKKEQDLLGEPQKSDREEPPEGTKQIELTNEHWQKISAYGGALALAFSASKNGEKSSKRFKELAAGKCTESNKISQWNAGDDFAFIHNFLLSSPSQSEYETSDFTIQLYSGILSTICSADEVSATKELVDYVTSDKFKNLDERYKQAANKIAKVVQNIHQTLYTGTASEHLTSIRDEITKNDRKKSFLHLGLAMLTFKGTAEKIIDYHQEDFEESDFFYFSLLAGMRAGLHKIPEWIRNIDGMNEFISTKMTQMAHHIIGSDLQFKEAAAPKTLVDLITKSTGFDFPLWLIDRLSISEYVTPIIKPKNGHSVRKDGSIVITGSLKPKLELNDSKYTEYMTKTQAQDIPYNEIYKKLSRR